MAAKTPDSVRLESMGSKQLVIATFATNDIDDGDTWLTGLSTNATDVWANGTDDPTQEKEGIDCRMIRGKIRFNVGEANRQGVVYVLANN